MPDQPRLARTLPVIAACVFLAGCRQGSEPAASRPAPSVIEITDALGRRLQFREPPRRIVIAGRAQFMIADALCMFPGVPSRIVALGETSQGNGAFLSLIEPSLKARASLNQTAGADQIAAYRPDLVLLKSYMESTVGKPLERLSIPVIYVDFETPDQYERDLRVLGRVFEQPERAEELARYYREGVLRVRTAVSGLPREGKPRVLLLYYSETRGSGAFNIPPASWIQTGMVAMAGGTPVWTEANPGKGWAQVSVEQVYAWDPDVIFVTAYTMRSDEVVRRLRADRNWQPVRALAGRRLYAFPGDFYSWDQPDARWLLGLAWMAARLHPDRFRDWDMMALARDFYRRVFARDDVFFETFVVPVLRGDLH